MRFLNAQLLAIVVMAAPAPAQVASGMNGREAARILKSSAWTRKAKWNIAPDNLHPDWTDIRNTVGGVTPKAVAHESAELIALNGFRQWDPPDLALRWETSAAVEQAVKASREEPVEDADGYYVISATPAHIPPRAAGHSIFAAPAIADQMWLDPASSTTLTIKGKKTIPSARTEQGERGGNPCLFFFFPRDQKIEPGDEVAFEADWRVRVTAPRGGVEDVKVYIIAETLRASFHPKDMAFRGQLEL